MFSNIYSSLPLIWLRRAREKFGVSLTLRSLIGGWLGPNKPNKPIHWVEPATHPTIHHRVCVRPCKTMCRWLLAVVAVVSSAVGGVRLPDTFQSSSLD